ncbi:MAG: hypothetical protein AAGM67_20295, partial [Bacteroidota bacterium]
IEKVKHYVGGWLNDQGIPLLGILPYEEELGLPVMATIASATGARVLHNEDQLDNRVSDIIAGSLIDWKNRPDFCNQLLVVSHKRLGEAIKKIQQVGRLANLEKQPLSGIIITGEGELTGEPLDYVKEHKLPVLHALIDTYEAVIKISRIEVKINNRTPWKVKKAVDLFREHINFPQ